MKKTDFINQLTQKTGLSSEQTEIVNKIFESNFFLSKKNAKVITAQISDKLNIETIL